jgi:hypothetical protein
MFPKLSTLSLLMCMFALGNAQPQPTKIIPQSPNTAAIEKYAVYPVSAYTGLPNISIPLYTISSRDVQLPVSLSYHAAGIKVAEEASRVGLGWALQAGGAITRTIMGMDDWLSRTDAYHVATAVPDAHAGPVTDFGTQKIQGDVGNCTIAAPSGGPNVTSYAESKYDMEPDVYNFSFSGYSGSFILRRNKTPVLLKNEKLEVTYLNATGSFQIKTPDGATYLFEQKEDYLDYYSPYSAGAPTVCAWHLTKITSATGEEVTFVYQVVSGSRVLVQGGVFQTLPPIENTGSPSAFSCWPNQQGIPSPNVPNQNINTPSKEYLKVYVDRINFRNGYVKFHTSGRDDLQSDIRIDSIHICQTSNQVIKRWLFYYDYFTGTGDEDRQVGTLATRSKRLKLSKIAEKGPNNEETAPYSFVYNEAMSSSNAPQKTSFAVDHWGYYNGKFQNGIYAPEILPNYTTNVAAKVIGSFGNNRDADPQFNQLFILKELKYPTGGRTVFEYETHDFDIKKSNVNDNSFFANFPEILKKTIEKNYAGNVYTQQPAAAQTANYILDLSDLMVDENDPYPTAAVQLTAFFRRDGSQSDVCLHSGVVANLCKEDGTVLSSADIAFFLGSSNPNGPITTCAGSSPYYIGAEFRNTYILPPGKYIWKLQISQDVTYLQDVRLKIEYYANKQKQDINNNGEILSGAEFGGGLRVKRIKQYDNFSSTPINVKRFQYNYTFNGKKYSYGRRMARPVYAYFDKTWYHQICGTTNVFATFYTWTRHIQSESTISLEHTIAGAAVAYDTVLVYEGENGENGRTIYHYENQPHTILDYSQQDYIFQTSTRIPRKPPSVGFLQNYGNGNLLDETIERNAGGSFIPVTRTVNTYTELQNTGVAQYFGMDRRDWANQVPQANCRYEVFMYPTMVRSRKILTGTTVTEYDQNSVAQYLTTSSTKSYNNTTHLQLVSETRTDSRGRTKSTTFKYPLDFSDANDDNAIASMKTTSHLHQLPIVTEKTVTSGGTTSTESLEITKYVIDPVSGKVLPAEVASLDRVQPVLTSSIPVYVPSTNAYPTNVTTKLLTTRYDALGNVLEMKKADDITVSYIWDYNNQHPIAEATNATYPNVAHTSFESDGKGNWSYTGTATIDATTITGSKAFQLSNAPAGLQKTGLTSATTYILSYWTKNASAFTVTGTQGTPATGRTVNGWKYFEHRITGQTQVTLSGTGWIDEVRLFPADATMRTFTYEPLKGMTSSMDQRNIVTYFDYDGLNRLQLIKDENKNIARKAEYKYQQFPHANPVWEATGMTRCKPCPANAAYISNVLQSQEINVNPLSGTFNQLQWVDAGVASQCAPAADFQNTATALRCQKNNSNYNTGQQEREQKDMNPCSPTYNNTQWIVAGTNTVACPLPTVAIHNVNMTTTAASASFYNRSTGVTYNMSLPINSLGSVAGNVPYGSYNVTINTNGSTNRTIAIDGLTQVGTLVTFYSVYLEPTSNAITINP